MVTLTTLPALLRIWKSGYRAEIPRLAAHFTGWGQANRKFDALVENVIEALGTDEGGGRRHRQHGYKPTSRLNRRLCLVFTVR